MTEGTQRKLAAVMCADVAGYSRMMGQDEDGTLAALKAHRNAVDPFVFNAGGRIVKTTGDGMLIEFASVLAAVKSSLAVQREMTQRNATLPTDRRMQFRIGIHVGEIIVDDGDIFGDTVNIAARLQEIAEPGGVAMSQAARDSVHQHLDTPLINLGPQELKNIAEPVNVWRIDMGGTQSNALQAAAATTSGERAAVAVLPFDNMSADQDQEFFAEGISEDIISLLSRVAGLRVIARNSTFAYKGQAKDVRLIAAELDARYILEGSVRRAGNRIRITAQLIDASDGQHIWAERYDRQFDDVFEVQDEITGNIVARIAPELIRSESRRVEEKSPNQMGAWEFYLRAQASYHQATKEGILKCEEFCQKALAIEPEHAVALRLLSQCQFQLIIFGMRKSSAKYWADMEAQIERAMRLDPADPVIQAYLVSVLAWSGKWDDALALSERVANDYPLSVFCRHARGLALYQSGEHERAVGEFEKGIKVSPNDPENYQFQTLLAYCQYLRGNYVAALSWADEALRAVPNFAQALGIRAATLAQLERTAEANAAIGHFLEAFPGTTATRHCRSYRWRKPEDIEHYRAGLIKAGLPE